MATERTLLAECEQGGHSELWLLYDATTLLMKGIQLVGNTSREVKVTAVNHKVPGDEVGVTFEANSDGGFLRTPVHWRMERDPKPGKPDKVRKPGHIYISALWRRV